MEITEFTPKMQGQNGSNVATSAHDLSDLLGENTPAPVRSALTLDSLSDVPQWVAWQTEKRNDRPTKVPYQSNATYGAKSTEPATWCIRSKARAAEKLLTGKPKGVGIVLGKVQGRDGLRLGGVDLDSCLDPLTDELAPWAKEVVDRFASYTEVSPSGTGVKIFFRYEESDAVLAAMGTTAEGKQRWGRDWSLGNHTEIAVYLQDRYFAVTRRNIYLLDDEIRPVSAANLLWLINEAGPAFVDDFGIDDLGTHSTKDNSRSGRAFRLALRLQGDGKTFEDFESALESDADLAEWAKDKRQVKRAWKNGGKNWRTALDRNEDGDVLRTTHNAFVTVRDHPATKGCFGLNDFTETMYLIRRPGAVFEGGQWNPSALTDAHVEGVKVWMSRSLEKGGAGLPIGIEDTRIAINECGRMNKFHPVRDLLNSLQHDGATRADRLFIDYLGCPDTPYYREAARNMLMGAVTRVFEPGHKFDFMAILEGRQGVRKSTFVKTLAMGYGGDPQLDWSDAKQLIEQTEGFWLIEVPELSSLAKAEINDLKAQISRSFDRARLAYGHEPVTRQRQCIFIGSTNDSHYLRDETGNRRYWPIPIKVEAIDTNRLQRAAPQIWAEAVGWYRAARAAQPGGTLDLSLSPAARAEAETMQASRKGESADEIQSGQIGAWLDSPVGDDIDPEAPKRYRQVTCTAQIWREMMGKTVSMPKADAMQIGKALSLAGWQRSNGPIYEANLKSYGKQYVYRRPQSAPPIST